MVGLAVPVPIPIRKKVGTGKSRSRFRKIFGPELQDFVSGPKRENYEISYFSSMSDLSNERENIKFDNIKPYFASKTNLFC